MFEALLVHALIFGPMLWGLLMTRRVTRLYRVIAGMLRVEHETQTALIDLLTRVHAGEAVSPMDLEGISRGLFRSVRALDADRADPYGLTPWRRKGQP